jgi:hypothetical protein
MGIGSPRLLGQLVARSALVAVAALVLAPHAFAGGLAPTGTPTVPASVANTVSQAQAALPSDPALSAPIVTAARSTPIAQATSVATSRIPVQTVSLSSLATAVTKQGRLHEPSRPAAQRSARKAPVVTRRQAGVQAAGTSAGRPRPAGAITSGLSSLQAGDLRLERFLPQLTPRPDASPSDGSPLPQPPAPLSPGAGGAFSGGGGAGLVLLLLALIAATAGLVPPDATRRLLALFAAPRPHPFLLRLERPD